MTSALFLGRRQNFSAENMCLTSGALTFEPIILSKWLTLHFKDINLLFWHHDVWSTNRVSFCLCQQFFLTFWSKHAKIMSDFHQNFRKCFTYWYYADMNINLFASFKQTSSQFSYFINILEILPTLGKTPINILQIVMGIPKFQELEKIIY